jgi:hypothetical protein
VRYRLKPEHIEPFQRHRAGLAERCQESPTTTTVRLLGAYRLF